MWSNTNPVQFHVLQRDLNKDCENIESQRVVILLDWIPIETLEISLKTTNIIYS